MPLLRSVVFLVVGWLVALGRAEGPLRSADDGPLPPEQSMKHLSLADDWLIELVAAEPDVASPVAMTWDERGGLYVAEMRDYPNSDTGGTIRRLEDADGDGRMDRSVLYAEGLRFPNSVLAWRGGLLVTSAPDILWLCDDDGDGRADRREVILTGFVEGNQQLRVNGLTLGTDGWVYAANGRSGGNITSPKRPGAAPVSIDRHDLRFRPDTGAVEAVAGFSQFGLAIDAWGHRFINWNTVPFRHVVFPLDVASRHPEYPLPADCEVLDDPVVGSRVFPRGGRPMTFNREPPGYFNASCGLAVEKSGLFPAQEAGSLFVCEPLFNIVHRRKLIDHGVTFQAARPKAEQDREFLSSSDPWFRPVACAFGPDGCLYVADFYRRLVEHPDFVRPDLREGVTWDTGKEYGRIYRLHPRATKPTAVVDLSKRTDKQLWETLDDASTWRRETARRLLSERDGSSLASRCEGPFAHMKTPLGRAQVVSLAIASGTISPGLWRKIDEAGDPQLIEYALRAARGAKLTVPRELLVKYANSASARLRFEVVLASASLADRIDILGAALAATPSDPWLDRAACCVAGNQAGPLIVRLAHELPADRRADFFESCAELVGARRDAEETEAVDQWLATSSGPRAHAVAVGVILGGARSNAALPAMLGGKPIEQWMALARGVVGDEKTSLDDRTRAARMLAHDPSAEGTTALAELVGGETEPALRSAALATLRARADAGVGGAILAQWSAASPSAKREMLDALFARKSRWQEIVAALEEGTISPAEVDPERQRQLLEQSEPALQERVQAIFQARGTVDRSALVREMSGQLPASGRIEEGARVFAKNCAGCHRVGEIGVKVGPDIAGLINKSREQVLEEILDPNRQVLPDYLAVQIMTEEGVSISGLIAEESAASITLRRAEGGVEAIPRSKIEELRATGRSLMPEGFEQSLSPVDLADLIAFLRGVP